MVVTEKFTGYVDRDLLPQDTIVRYSAAKYISRLADLLPRSLASQIVESTIALFSGTPDDPLVETERGKVVDPGGGSNGDAKWHGLCLALAEMGRRGLVEDDMVGDLLGWAIKARKLSASCIVFKN